MAFMRRSQRRNEKAAWMVAAGAGVGAGAALLYLLDPARRTRAASTARQAGHRAMDAARTSRGAASAALHRGAERARELAGSARQAGEAARAKAQELAGEVGARVQEAKRQLEELRGTPDSAADDTSTAAAVLLGRALLGKGLLRVPFGLAGIALARRSAPVRRAAATGARVIRTVTGALRTERERLVRGYGLPGAPGATGQDGPGQGAEESAASVDADHPSVPGVGEVRDPLEAAGREPPFPPSPRTDAPEEEGGPGLQPAARGEEDGSTPLVAAPHEGESSGDRT